MNRTARRSYPPPSYPELTALLHRRVLVTGAMAGSLVLAGACTPKRTDLPPQDSAPETGWPIDGGIADTASPVEVLLPITGTRTVDFAYPEGWLQYHLVLVVDDADPIEEIQAHAEDVLGAVDAILLAHPIADLADPATLPGVEDEVRQAVQDTLSAQVGYVTFHSVALVLDVLEEVEQVDGDIGRAG